MGAEAVGLAFVGGHYALQQVRLAGTSLDEYRSDRAKQDYIETRQVLIPLLNELHQNRLAALALEARLEIAPEKQREVSTEFSLDAFRALRSGPLWRLSGNQELFNKMLHAYQAAASVRVDIRWWAAAATAMVGIFGLFSPAGKKRDAMVTTGVIVVARLLFRQRICYWSGRATQVRAAIEEAMELTYFELERQPIDWAGQSEALLRQGMNVKPLAAVHPRLRSFAQRLEKNGMMPEPYMPL